MSKLDDKVGLVTGSATGIGRAIVLRMAEEGARIVLTDRDSQRLEGVRNEVVRVSPESVAKTMDVTSGDEVRSIVEWTIQNFGRIDLLVNNAGVSTMGRFTELTEEEWDLNMNVNLKGVWRVTKEVAPHMVRAKRGKIVMVASMAAKLGAPFLAHYTASKFGVLGFVQAAAKELAEYGITVNAVCPGFVHTEMQDREVVWEAKLRGIADPSEIRQEYVKMTPLRRLCEPTDVANVVGFLLSSDSDFMTGQGLNVTGGVCVH